MALERTYLAFVLTITASYLGACERASYEDPWTGSPNVILIDIDSLRADRLLALRDGEPIAPNISGLAERGRVFEQHIAQSAWTLPALTSILSGHWPIPLTTHGARIQWRQRDTRLIPDILGLYGYQTAVCAGITLPSDAMIGGQFRFQLQPETRGEQDYVTPLSQWVEHQAQEPFFALLHDMDLHHPIDLPYTERSCAWFPDPSLCTDLESSGPKNAFTRLRRQLSATAAQEVTTIAYDASIASYDNALGGLFQALERRGIADRTIIVVTSNHGEELGEHGLYTHGVHYDTVLRVPLIIYDPRRPGGPAIPQQVQSIDIAPTILDLTGVTIDATMNGQSLQPLLEGDPEAYELRDAFSLSDAQVASVRSQTHKLIFHPSGEHRGSGRGMKQERETPREMLTEYYDLSEDPGELNDLGRTATAPSPLDEDRLRAWLQERVEAGKSASQDQPHNNPQLRERLRDDGYWSHVDAENPPPKAPSGR